MLCGLTNKGFGMTVKELKEAIKDMPNDFVVYTRVSYCQDCSDGVTAVWYEDAELDDVWEDKDKIYFSFV